MGYPVVFDTASERGDNMESLLKVEHLKTAFKTDFGPNVAVDDVSFNVNRGETVAIVGESGSGKSVTALSILQLLGKRGYIADGSIMFAGTELTQTSKSVMQQIRGNEISMVFQEPMTALNPVLKVGYQLVEAIRLHTTLSKQEAKLHAVHMLKKVGLPDPERVMGAYPFALSGGMRQRVLIAMALACKPKLLIADEPTTALDVTVQAQIMRVMKQLCAESGTAILLITHDLGVVAEMADRVIVMYAGQVVEEGTVYDIFENPKHPYTEALLRAVPTLTEEDVLHAIPGSVPRNYQHLTGCRFANRCAYAEPHCRKHSPELIEIENGQQTRCFEWKKLEVKEGAHV